jgi:putative DNA primase/helicase
MSALEGRPDENRAKAEVSRADASGALASRFIVITLQRSFYGKEDLGLTERLLGELPGIFNWAIAGWQQLQERGYFQQGGSN